MKNFVLAVSPGCLSEFCVVASSLKEARQMLWTEMPDAIKNCCESIECVEESEALMEQMPGVQGNPFQHLHAANT